MSSKWNNPCFRRALYIGVLLSMPALSADGQQTSNPRYSRRLGVYYEFVTYGNSYGARLTNDPVPGSPLLQGQARLERGDTITHLDNLPINGPDDLENHYAQTAVAFLNVRNGQAGACWIFLPALDDPGVPPSAVVPVSYTPGYSPRLGAYFTLVPYGSAYGIKLTKAPVPGSPLRQAQAQLEQGDMITHLDGHPITGAAQLEVHHSQTAVTFVNVRTGQPQGCWIYLPVANAPGVPPSLSVADRVLPPISDVPPPPPELIIPDAVR